MSLNITSGMADLHQLLLTMLQVLIFDNNSDSRDLLSVFFELRGIEAITVKTAGEALDLGILRRAKPNLLVSEINYPLRTATR